jgi:tRNA dimethylallyltransferase
MLEYNLITILGPTASGKTLTAAHLAYRLSSAVISADSRQVYRMMDIGTGKDLSDYRVNGMQVPYYLLNICNPGYKYNVFEYQKDFYEVYQQLRQDGKVPILCGGSGLYIESVLSNYQLLEVPINERLRASLAEKSLDELTDILKQYKSLHNSTDIDTKKRAIRAIEIADYQKNNPVDFQNFAPQIHSLIIGIYYERAALKQRITERLKKRLDEGLIDEVRELLKSGLSVDDLIYYGLEYKYVTLYITGQLSFDEMFSKLNIAIHQFSKRQMTWFRRMERKGFEIHWLDGMMEVDRKVEEILKLFRKA